MRTSIILPDDLYRRVKRSAAEAGQTVTSVLEEALRRELDRRARTRSEASLAPPTGSGGTLAGVDLTNNAALLDVLDDDHGPTSRR